MVRAQANFGCACRLFRPITNESVHGVRTVAEIVRLTSFVCGTYPIDLASLMCSMSRMIKLMETKKKIDADRQWAMGRHCELITEGVQGRSIVATKRRI